MDSRETKRTVPVPSVGADGEQPNSQTTTQSIAEETAENNPQEERFRGNAPGYAAHERPSLPPHSFHERPLPERLPEQTARNRRSALPWDVPLCGSAQGGQVVPDGPACLPCQHGPPPVGLPCPQGDCPLSGVGGRPPPLAGAAVPNVRHRGHRQSALCGLRQSSLALAWKNS